MRQEAIWSSSGDHEKHSLPPGILQPPPLTQAKILLRSTWRWQAGLVPPAAAHSMAEEVLQSRRPAPESAGAMLPFDENGAGVWMRQRLAAGKKAVSSDCVRFQTAHRPSSAHLICRWRQGGTVSIAKQNVDFTLGGARGSSRAKPLGLGPGRVHALCCGLPAVGSMSRESP